MAPDASAACTPRYRCGFPGCNKRYASTDGVRKHARKTHTQWLKEVDEQSSLRDHKLYGNKPSTYCTMETPEGALPSGAAVAAAAVAALPQGALPEQLLQQFLARYQSGGNAAVANMLLGAGEAVPASLALTPSSLLLGSADAAAGCKRDVSALLDSHEMTKRMRIPSLAMWGSSGAEEPELLDAVDESSSSLASSPRDSSDLNHTPLTVPLPRPLSNSGEVSPFQLDKSSQEGSLLPPQAANHPKPEDALATKPAAICDDLFSFTMDDDDSVTAFLQTILA